MNMEGMSEEDYYKMVLKEDWKNGITKDGCYPLSVFGKEYSPHGYCWLEKGVLHLPMIIVNEQDRGKGSLIKLLKKAMEYDIVKIWIPSSIIAKKSYELGFYYEQEYIDYMEEMCDVMVYRKWTNYFEGIANSILEIGESCVEAWKYE